MGGAPKPPDLTGRLMDAADDIDELSRSELQVLLRQAAHTIETLRTLFGIKDEILLEDEPPAGNA